MPSSNHLCALEQGGRDATMDRTTTRDRSMDSPDTGLYKARYVGVPRIAYYIGRYLLIVENGDLGNWRVSTQVDGAP